MLMYIIMCMYMYCMICYLFLGLSYGLHKKRNIVCVYMYICIYQGHFCHQHYYAYYCFIVTVL